MPANKREQKISAALAASAMMSQAVKNGKDTWLKITAKAVDGEDDDILDLIHQVITSAMVVHDLSHDALAMLVTDAIFKDILDEAFHIDTN